MSKGLNIKRKKDLTPHCETIYENNKCPYIELGCTGCLIKQNNITLTLNKNNLNKIKSLLNKRNIK